MSKKYPINISLFFNKIDKSTMQLPIVQELLQITTSKDSINKYIYAFYSDTNLLSENIFIPIFHTMYLGCQKNNVILTDNDSFWLTEVFSHNNFYYYGDETIESDKIKKISSIKEIL